MKQKMKIQPRGKYILVHPAEPEARENEFGIITPTNVEQEQKAQGEVLAVGSEIKDVKVGDRVIYGAYAGESIKMKESLKELDYKLLHDDDVIAFIK